MQGLQPSFIAKLERRIEGKQTTEWLMQQASITATTGAF
jgi:hypothetical protein